MFRVSKRDAARRRRAVVVVSAALTFIAVEYAVRKADPALRAYYIDRFERKRAAVASLDAPPRIVLLGSSRANYALVPEEFEALTGRSAFNISVPATKVIEWQIMAREALPALKPELVVLGINASEVRADYLPLPAARDMFTLRDFASYCATDGWSSEIAQHFVRRNLGRACGFWHRRYEIKCWLQESAGVAFPKYAQHARERREMIATPCPPDGYEHPWLIGERLADLQAQLDTCGEDRVWKAAAPAYSPTAKAAEHFADLLDWFAVNEIPLIVAYLPNSPRTEARWADVEPALERMIARICEDRRVTYLSCPAHELPRSNADYLEELHAGLDLGRRISRRIAQHIVRVGLLDQSPVRIRVVDATDEETGTP